MSVVLVVGRDGLLAVTLRREAEARREPLEIRSLRPGEKGLELLRVGSADILLLDLASGDSDGEKLIGTLRRSIPDVPLLVRAADEPGPNTLAGVRWLKKEPDMAALYDELAETLKKELRTTVSGIHIGHFLQLVAADKKTVTVRVKGRGEEGLLFFKEGELCHALLGNASGREAALEILSLADEPEMEVRKFYSHCERTVTDSVDALVVAAERLRAERKEEERGSGKRSKAGKGDAMENANILKAIASMPGVAMSAIARRDGILVEETGGGQRLSTLLAYLGMESERVRALLGYEPPRHLVLSCSSGDKVVVLFGEELCAGFMVEPSAQAAPVVARAAAVLKEAGIVKEGGGA